MLSTEDEWTTEEEIQVNGSSKFQLQHFLPQNLISITLCLCFKIHFFLNIAALSRITWLKTSWNKQSKYITRLFADVSLFISLLALFHGLYC